MPNNLSPNDDINIDLVVTVILTRVTKRLNAHSCYLLIVIKLIKTN